VIVVNFLVVFDSPPLWKTEEQRHELMALRGMPLLAGRSGVSPLSKDFERKNEEGGDYLRLRL